MSVIRSTARTIRSGSPTDTQTVSRTPHSRGISILFRSRTTLYQPPFTPESIDNSTRPDGSDTLNCSALAGTLLTGRRMLLKCINSFIQVDFRPDLQQRPLFKRKKSRIPICRTSGTMPEPGEDWLFRYFIPAASGVLHTTTGSQALRSTLPDFRRLRS